MSPKKLYVSTTGSDETGTGSATKPFRTIGKAVTAEPPPSTILLYGGTYLDPVVLKDVGSPDQPVTIRAVPGEQAVIESAARDVVDHKVHFRDIPNSDWMPGVSDDEYVSTRPFPPGTNHGAFLDLPGHPHLVPYSKLQDFRATNQKWGRLKPDDPPPPGLEFVPANRCKKNKRNKECTCVPLEFSVPHVYMGPGLFQDEDGHLHIRLTPTENLVPGFPDYQGERDPRLVRLAIWTAGPTVSLTRCHNVRLRDLTLRFGRRTVAVEKSTGVRLRNLRIEAGEYGVRFGDDCKGTSIRHCRVDGGMPTWLFRSDLKDVYHYVAPDGQCLPNNLAGGIAGSLIMGTPTCVDTLIENCEFTNGHDLQLFGVNTRFRRNWLSNINDDALILDAKGLKNLRVRENVIEQCLTAFSFAQDHVVGPVYLYRNLVDLRQPTAGIRPHWNAGQVEPLRHGHLFKENDSTGQVDLVHNTFVVTRQRAGAASYAHFSSWDHRRRSLNNIFVAVNPETPHDRPITFLPTPPAPGLAEGNCYHRSGRDTKHLFLFRRYQDPVTGTDHDGDTIADLAALQAHHLGTFGIEAGSVDEDPQFMRFTAGPAASQPIDLRLAGSSPCRDAAVALPPDLPANASPGPDIGCYPADFSPLAVGVDGSRLFPPAPGGPPVAPT